jgi:hypothetical protein
MTLQDAIKYRTTGLHNDICEVKLLGETQRSWILYSFQVGREYRIRKDACILHDTNRQAIDYLIGIALAAVKSAECKRDEAMARFKELSGMKGGVAA